MTFSVRRSGGLIARQVVTQEGAFSATKLKWPVPAYQLDVILTAVAFRFGPVLKFINSSTMTGIGGKPEGREWLLTDITLDYL